MLTLHMKLCFTTKFVTFRLAKSPMLHFTVKFSQNTRICRKWICKAKFHMIFLVHSAQPYWSTRGDRYPDVVTWRMIQSLLPLVTIPYTLSMTSPLPACSVTVEEWDVSSVSMVTQWRPSTSWKKSKVMILSRLWSSVWTLVDDCVPISQVQTS